MTYLDDGTIVTDLHAHTTNQDLLTSGYTVRQIETWHAHDEHSFILWDAPEITEEDLPY